MTQNIHAFEKWLKRKNIPNMNIFGDNASEYAK